MIFGLNSPSPPLTFSGVDEIPNQRLAFPLYGPFSSSPAFFYSGTLRFRPSGRAFFYRGSLHLFPLFSQKKRENDFGGNRTPNIFCLFIKDKPLSHLLCGD